MRKYRINEKIVDEKKIFIPEYLDFLFWKSWVKEWNLEATAAGTQCDYYMPVAFKIIDGAVKFLDKEKRITPINKSWIRPLRGDFSYE